MALDPSIALGVRPVEVQNPLNQFAQMAQLQGLQQSNQLNELKMQEARAAGEERNALRQLNPANADYENQLFKVNPQLGIQYRKERTTAEAQAATAANQKVAAAAEKQKMLGQAWRDISGRPSDANIIAHLEDIQTSPLYDAQEKASIKAKADSLLAMPLAERKPFLERMGSTGADYTSRANNAATVGATIRGQNMTDAREKQRIALEGERVEIARDEANRKKQGMEALPPKEIQKREAALPAATAAIKGFETKSDSFVKDLEKLRDHPGLAQITGIAAGRLPGVTADGRAAQALYDKIVAKGGFQALQDLRDASKTGGALGNVSNQEGKQLSASFAAIQRTQDAADVRAAIDQAIGDIQGSKTRMREAYDATYSYKQPAAASNIDALLEKYK
ncbi:MAG: hypothetical protein ACR2IJ_10200 [Fluviibacter sp.]